MPENRTIEQNMGSVGWWASWYKNFKRTLYCSASVFFGDVQEVRSSVLGSTELSDLLAFAQLGTLPSLAVYTDRARMLASLASSISQLGSSGLAVYTIEFEC